MPYHKLDVYKKLYQCALEIHKLTLRFPKFEQFEMANQIRRSSKSVPALIAEGMGRQTSHADVRNFIRNARGSCDETKVWLEFSKDLNYITSEEFKKYQETYNEIGKMLTGVIRRYS